MYMNCAQDSYPTLYMLSEIILPKVCLRIFSLLFALVRVLSDDGRAMHDVRAQNFGQAEGGADLMIHLSGM